MKTREIALRPASARRIGNLRALVVEFTARDIGNAGVALLLGCSLTAARNYVAELLDAAVIVAHPVRQAAGGLDRTLYSRSADPLTVADFLAALARRQRAADLQACGSWCSEVDVDVVRRAASTPARRDPLVAALFGAPRPC